MAEHITVRGEQAAPAGAATDGSAKKSQLDQQVEALGARIKNRTGRAPNDDVLRAMIVRRHATAERAEHAQLQQKEFVKTASQETLQTRAHDPHATLTGRTREANVGDGLTNHQRQLVTSDPNAPAILPGATQPQITPQGAQSFLERALGLLSSEGAPLTIESYAETLVPRPPSGPADKNARESTREGAPRGGTLTRAPHEAEQHVALRAGEPLTTRADEQPQRPLPGPSTGSGGTTETGTPTDRPTSGRPTTGTPQPPSTPSTPQPTPSDAPTFGRPTAGAPDVDGTTGKPQLPQSGTVHLTPKRGTGQPAQPPVHSGMTLLGKTTVSGAHATDASTTTPLATVVPTKSTTVAASPGKPAGGPPRPTGTAGAPAGRGTRSAAALSSESSSPGTTMSLRGGARRTRATDVTTGPDGTVFINTGGGIDTTTSWNGRDFNWEAFYVRFMFKFQVNENEARRLMKKLREAMHKLAQEGIKAKIALEKMNQAFERAEKAFELGAAMKSVMEAAQSAAKQGAQEGGQQGQKPGQTQGQEQGKPQGQQAQGQGQNSPPSSRNPTQRNGPTDVGSNPGQATPRAGAAAGQPQTAGGGPRPAGQQDGGGGGQGQGQGQDQGQGQGGGGGGEGHGLPGGGLVGNVSEHLRRDMEKLNAEVISQAQRGASEMDGKVRSAYMQAQGLFNQMCQLLAMSRSKGA